MRSLPIILTACACMLSVIVPEIPQVRAQQFLDTRGNRSQAPGRSQVLEPFPALSRPIDELNSPAEPTAEVPGRARPIVAAEWTPGFHQPALEDAALNDVCFVDAEFGWAVGDRGAIWATRNGGQTWELQPSGVTARLECCWFVDRMQGWAAGGTTQPLSHRSQSILLRTSDGGLTWTRVDQGTYPRVKRIRFHGAKFGWMLAESAPVTPSGLFTSVNGGGTWAYVAGPANIGWFTGDWATPGEGAVAGSHGALAAIRGNRLQPARSPAVGIRQVTNLRLAAPFDGWLVGDGGLILCTHDLGATWQLPPGEIPPALRRQFDWKAVAVYGNQCWIAGSPGTQVLHTADGGRSWKAFETGQQVPIHAMTFVNEQQGYAVGALGTILETMDGGKSWRHRKQGGLRVAAMSIVSKPEQLPFEALTWICGNEGYLGAAMVLTRSPQGTDPTAPSVNQWLDAILATGASYGLDSWAFPYDRMASPEQLAKTTAAWNQLHEGQAQAALERILVRQLRIWRPDVVLTQDAAEHDHYGLTTFFHGAILSAVEKSADPNYMPDQLLQAGLQPWQVKKVLGTLPAGRYGSVNLNSADFAPRLGGSLGDYAVVPRSLLSKEVRLPQAQLGFVEYVNRLPQSQGSGGFFAGIQIPPGTDARRNLTEFPAEQLQALQQQVQKTRLVQGLIRKAQADPAQLNELLGQLPSLLATVDERQAGVTLYLLAIQLREQGQWLLAARVLEELTRSYPRHAFAAEAARWHCQFLASAEAAKHAHATDALAVPLLAHDNNNPDAGAATAGFQSDTADLRGQSGRLASYEEPSTQRAAPRIDPLLQARRDQLLATIQQLESSDPAASTTAPMALLLASMDRQLGQAEVATQRLLNVDLSGDHSSWAPCVLGERWLANRQGPPPVPTVTCDQTPFPPRLDGDLNDDCWQSGGFAQLRAATETPPAAVGAETSDLPPKSNPTAKVWFAKDEKFLYMAAEMPLQPGRQYPASQARTGRDADFSEQDHLQIWLDVDRDFATAYRLQIDQRGQVADDCWGDSDWNPKWFVAHQVHAQFWSVEIAIPLAELTASVPESLGAWGLSIRRKIPEMADQELGRTAEDGSGPATSAYLMFR